MQIFQKIRFFNSYLFSHLFSYYNNIYEWTKLSSNTFTTSSTLFVQCYFHLILQIIAALILILILILVPFPSPPTAALVLILSFASATLLIPLSHIKIGKLKNILSVCWNIVQFYHLVHLWNRPLNVVHFVLFFPIFSKWTSLQLTNYTRIML